MIDLTQSEKYSLNLHLKKSIFESSKILGCELSEFKVINFCKKPYNLDDYWAELEWESDKNLRIRLIFEKHQPYLRQTFDNKEANIFVRWGAGLKPALHFSGGSCHLTQEESNRLIRQFPELPKLPQPSSERLWKKIGIKITEPLITLGESYAHEEKSSISMALETPKSLNEYEIRNDLYILRFSRIKNNFVINFSIKNKVVDNEVKLVVIGDSNRELINETQALMYQKDRHRFRYVLPDSIASKVKEIIIYY